MTKYLFHLVCAKCRRNKKYDQNYFWGEFSMICSFCLLSTYTEKVLFCQVICYLY